MTKKGPVQAQVRPCPRPAPPERPVLAGLPCPRRALPGQLPPARDSPPTFRSPPAFQAQHLLPDDPQHLTPSPTENKFTPLSSPKPACVSESPSPAPKGQASGPSPVPPATAPAPSVLHPHRSRRTFTGSSLQLGPPGSAGTASSSGASAVQPRLNRWES